MTTVSAPQQALFRQYLVLTKPRVTQLAVFCAVIGMFLASPGLPDLGAVVAGTVGIWLLAAAAFAVNCLIEQQIDQLAPEAQAILDVASVAGIEWTTATVAAGIDQPADYGGAGAGHDRVILAQSSRLVLGSGDDEFIISNTDDRIQECWFADEDCCGMSSS